MRKVILASASPRRKEILEQVGMEFHIIPSTCEEICAETEPSNVVRSLALQKAEDIAGKINGDFVVIGSDTVVAKDGQILGKPVDEKHAFEMLDSLQGDIHQVYSGVALVWNENSELKQKKFYAMTEVEIFPMTKQQIADYIATRDCMDKAGAYGIQGCFAEHVKGIKGDYYNVVGLPISLVMKELRACHLI